MGRPATGNRKYEIQNIWDTHREIMRYLVMGQFTGVQIAEMCNVTPVTVSNVMNSAICKRQMELMRAERDLDAVDVAKRIQEISPIALQTLEELMCEGTETTRFKVATDLLDRAGHSAVHTLRTENFSAQLTKDDILEIRERAKNMGLCVDVTPILEVESI